MKILHLNVCFCLCLFLTNCIAPPYRDISQEAKMQHLTGHCLELKQDVFLFQFSDTRTYALNVPGRWSALPTSIEEYQNDPSNWQNTDSNARIGKGPKQGYDKEKIMGIIPKGTKIFIHSIEEKKTLYESFIRVIGYLDDPRYSDLPVNIYFLLNIEHGDIIIPYPSEPEATVMGREIIPYPKAGVIEYCD